MELDGDTNYYWRAWNGHQRLGTGRVGNWRSNLDHPDYSIVEISQNTEKSLGDLRRLATPMKDHQLTLK